MASTSTRTPSASAWPPRPSRAGGGTRERLQSGCAGADHAWVTQRRVPFSTVRLFVAYAVVTVIPVLVLGLALAADYRDEAQRRGLDRGRAASVLLARTGIEPLLEGHPLADGLTDGERTGLDRLMNGI